MSITDQVKLDRSSRDLAAIIRDFVDPGGHLEQSFGPEFIEFRDTELGFAIIELISGIGDVFNAAADRVGNEGFFTTAVEIQSILDLAQGATYVPKSNTPSRWLLTFVTEELAALTLDKGMIMLTDSTLAVNVPFELEAEVNKGIGVTTFTGIFRAGRTINHPPFVSSGTGLTSTTLVKSNVIAEDIIVVIGGVTWDRVATFATANPTDTFYRLSIQELVPGERKTRIIYGDGIKGAFPPFGSLVEIEYREGGGLESNVPLNTITRFEEPVRDSGGNVVTITGTNDTAALQLGIDAESRDEIRVNAPVFFRTNERMVSNEDHEDAAIQAGAVRATTVTNNESSLIEENTVMTFVATSISATTPPEDAAAIRTQMLVLFPGRDTRREVTAPCQTLSFVYTVTVHLEETANQSEVQPLVDAALASFFAVDSLIGDPQKFVLDIGQRVFRSNVTRIIDKIQGVDHIEIAETGDIQPSILELPITDTTTWPITYVKD